MNVMELQDVFAIVQELVQKLEPVTDRVRRPYAASFLSLCRPKQFLDQKVVVTGKYP